MSEITFEITNYCPYSCRYCSSDSEQNMKRSTFLDINIIYGYLKDKTFDHIIISGGEPLSHPKFYNILEICKKHSKDVVVYTNALTHIIYNSSIIDGIYLEANLTILPEVDKVHILRRVKQGKEANRPEVHLSQNFSADCSCEHRIVRPDGHIYKTPCNKWVKE